MQNAGKDYSHITGWGVDANRQNDPTIPMKKRNDGEHAGYSWQRPAQQRADVEVLQSNERPNLTATFGTSTPPRGLSGALRRRAFRHSESSYLHWLPLMLADRINVVEGVVSDVARGRIPNIFAELGWAAEWKYNKKRFMTRVAVESIVVAALLAGTARLLRPRRPRRRRASSFRR